MIAFEDLVYPMRYVDERLFLGHRKAKLRNFDLKSFHRARFSNDVRIAKPTLHRRNRNDQSVPDIFCGWRFAIKVFDDTHDRKVIVQHANRLSDRIGVWKKSPGETGSDNGDIFAGFPVGLGNESSGFHFGVKVMQK